MQALTPHRAADGDAREGFVKGVLCLTDGSLREVWSSSVTAGTSPSSFCGFTLIAQSAVPFPLLPYIPDGIVIA